MYREEGKTVGVTPMLWSVAFLGSVLLLGFFIKLVLTL